MIVFFAIFLMVFGGPNISYNEMSGGPTAAGRDSGSGGPSITARASVPLADTGSGGPSVDDTGSGGPSH